MNTPIERQLAPPAGWHAATPRIARTGIQLYSGEECGKGFSDLETVRVYRPEEEVFAKDAVHSYTHLTLTNDHPPEMVTPENWKKYGIGDTGDEVLRDGNAARVPMMMRDAKAIQDYKDGKKQMSVGYTCDLERVSGTTPTGEKFDAVQRNIRANHLAQVTAARGGPTLSIGDNKQQETVMTDTLRQVMVDGIACAMSDTSAAIVTRTITNLQSQIDAFKKKVEETEEEGEEEKDKAKKDAAVAADAIKVKDAEIATLKQQLTDAQDPKLLDALHKDRIAAIDSAVKIVPKDQLRLDGESTESIRRQVVMKKMGDVAKAWDDKQIASSFASWAAQTNTGGGMQDARQAFMQPHVSNDYSRVDPRDSAYNDYNRDMTEAWRGPNSTIRDPSERRN